jgi:mannose/cellobiose epimerase-like protein (N-acyl-D-glucosamine 2-epimerase family)
MRRTKHSDGVADATRRFFDWLGNDALPLWSDKGVDWEGGGFVEQLTPGGEIVADVRRARVVARQIFAYRSAAELGWRGPTDELVTHGLNALLQSHVSSGFAVIPRYYPAEARGEGDFDLYDHAFVLFGLAHAFGLKKDEQLEQTAVSILDRMRGVAAQAGGGFAEHMPPRAPLKANPHMHLLEAGLAWSEVSSRSLWADFSGELVELCLTRFIDPATGALHEYFDTDWSRLNDSQDVVEPGHQAEWAWLLLRAARLHPGNEKAEAASRLMQIAEKGGLDRVQQRLINELNPDLSPRDCRLRLWPQTERIKALVAFQERAPTQAGEDRIAAAIDALLGYFDHPIAGSWWEHFDASGHAIHEPARASSLYHVMGAANELARFTGMRLD